MSLYASKLSNHRLEQMKKAKVSQTGKESYTSNDGSNCNKNHNKNHKPSYSSRSKNKYASNHHSNYRNHNRNYKPSYSSQSQKKYASDNDSNYIQNHNRNHKPSYSSQSQNKYASDNSLSYHRNNKPSYSSQSQDKYPSDNYSNHRTIPYHKSSSSSTLKNKFSIDPTYFSTKGIHTKKTRMIGPNLSDIGYRSDSVPIERNVKWNCNASKIIDGKKIPIGVSIEEYPVNAAIARRYNINIAKHEYQFVMTKTNENGEKEFIHFWTSEYENALETIVKFEEMNALKAVAQDHEFHLGLQRVQDSKPKFKVKANYSKSKSKSKSKVKRHYQKWNKKKQRGSSKKC